MPRRLIQDIPATPHFPFLAGAYRMSQWDIPYFTSTVSVSDAANNLRLASEIPGAEDINWKLDELFQRDLDWPRVERSIVPYLKRQESPQFFNSLTIALVPFSMDEGRVTSGFVDRIDWTPPGLSEADRFEKELNVGPLSFGFWNAWNDPHDLGFQSGEMRWNTDQIIAVAIDGQHRLAALKSIANGAQPGLAETRIPIIFLVFDGRLGYTAPQERSVVELLRVLFIDLNKHAQTVSRARQILLDDRDPHAVCVRRVVGTELRSDLNELQLTYPRLPLSMVDWHSEQARFDESPYISTVLGVDWIVSRMIGSKPISDFTDYNGVKKQLGRLRTQLGVELPTAWARVKELEEFRLRPFGYLDEELTEIATAFADVWSRPIATLLTKFSPYGQFMDLRIGDGSLSLEFQHWYRLYEQMERDPAAGRATDEYRRFLGSVSNRSEQPLSEDYFRSRLKTHREAKDGNLSFNVVFQRALVDGYLEYQKIADAAIDELAWFDEEDSGLPDLDLAEDLDSLEDEDDAAEDEFDVGEDEYEFEEVDDLGHSPSSSLGRQALRRVEEYVEILNEFVEAWPEVLSINATFPLGEDQDSAYFWAGTLRKPEGGIDFTQGASTRAKDLLFMIAVMSLYQKQQTENEEYSYDDFWSWVFDDDRPSVIHRFARAVDRFTRDERSAAGRILGSRDQDFDGDAAREEVYWRLAHVWEVMEP